MRHSLLTATITSVSIIAFGQIVSAADLPKAAPAAVVAPVPSWTGWYIGINGGGVWGTTDPTAMDAGPDSFFAAANVGAVTTNGSKSFNNSGGLAGGHIGYLYQTGPVVLGIEAGFDWMNLKGSTTVGPQNYPVNPTSNFTWNQNSKSDWLFTLLGRIGFNAGSWYPYLTGGLAVANLKYTTNYVETFYPTNNTFSLSEDKAGYAIGGGVEWRFAPHWLLRGEYLYLNFESINSIGTIACTPGVGACSPTGNRVPFAFSANFKENIARAALSYQF